jgi:hypothetical protein
MPTKRPPPLPRASEPRASEPESVEARLAGIGDFFEDAGRYIVDHGDQIADVLEVAVPIIAPYAAPVVAAEHALRKGIELSQQQAKAATQGATAVGKAVAQHVADTKGVTVAEVSPVVQGGSEEVSQTIRESQALPDPRKRKSAEASGNGLAIVAVIGLGILLFAMD